MPSDEKHEGLVLRSIDYKDRQKIITLFSPTCGIVSLIVKGISRKKSHLLTLTSPFTQGEYLFSIRRSNLYSFQDGTPINTHHSLRKTLPSIEAATLFAQSILSSQLPGKPAPDLYQLTLTYLKYLPSFSEPTPLTGSFLLKLLTHDGHLALSPTCAHCKNFPTHLDQGEPYCKAHAPRHAISFTPEEWSTLLILAKTRSIPQLQETTVSPELHHKIQRVFNTKDSF